MDCIRTMYTTTMRVWNDGRPGVPVRWFEPPPSALEFPHPHAFGSLDFVEDKEDDPYGIGELFPHREDYDAGANPVGYLGTTFCGRADSFLTGGDPALDPPLVTDDEGYSSCLGQKAENPKLGFRVIANGIQVGGHWGSRISLIAAGVQAKLAQPAGGIVALHAVGWQQKVNQTGPSTVNLYAVGEQGRPLHDYTPEALMTQDGHVLFVQPGTP